MPCRAERVGLYQQHPGRTQTINFYRIDGKRSTSSIFRGTDMPVFHRRYDGVEEADRKYLQKRETLKLSCLILDARRGWMEKDWI